MSSTACSRPLYSAMEPGKHTNIRVVFNVCVALNLLLYYDLLARSVPPFRRRTTHMSFSGLPRSTPDISYFKAQSQPTAPLPGPTAEIQKITTVPYLILCSAQGPQYSNSNTDYRSLKLFPKIWFTAHFITKDALLSNFAATFLLSQDRVKPEPCKHLNGD